MCSGESLSWSSKSDRALRVLHGNKSVSCQEHLEWRCAELGQRKKKNQGCELTNDVNEGRSCRLNTLETGESLCRANKDKSVMSRQETNKNTGVQPAQTTLSRRQSSIIVLYHSRAYTVFAMGTQGCTVWRWWMLWGFFTLLTIRPSLLFSLSCRSKGLLEMPQHTVINLLSGHLKSPQGRLFLHCWIPLCRKPQQFVRDYGHIAKHSDRAEQTGPWAKARHLREVWHSWN